MLAVIESELGAPVNELFASFDREPLAAASIGQAYAATLPDGSEVVVKVRRPGVVEQVEEDLDILHNLAATAARRWELADSYDVVGLAEEFAQTLRAELDYLWEDIGPVGVRHGSHVHGRVGHERAGRIDADDHGHRDDGVPHLGVRHAVFTALGVAEG
jgi:hypothetical protein